MIATQTPKLKHIFQNTDFAWDILEEEISLEAAGANIIGEDVANLLSLYMRGVQTLNQVRDSREIFFRNKLNNLMMRPNVVKALSAPKGKNPVTHDQQKEAKQAQESSLRKGELEMRLTYAQQEYSEEKLKKILVQHQTKTSVFTNTIQATISESRNKLQERIQQRKLRSATARERSVKTEDKVEKKQRETNNMEVINEIKEEHEERPKDRRQRSYSLDVKVWECLRLMVEVEMPRRVSLIIPSCRKQSD